MGYTTEQQNVIDAGIKNLLVSAAAGSGKTAVLVERIMKRQISDSYLYEKLGRRFKKQNRRKAQRTH